MSKARRFFDGIANVFTGLGTTSDPRRGNTHCLMPLTRDQIEARYRSSGLTRKAIDIPALDMVREWRDWQAESEQIEALEAEERRLGLRGKVKRVEELRGLGGGALILGVPGDPAMPANWRGLGAGQLAFVNVVNRYQMQLGQLVDDPLSPLFGGPEIFVMNTAGRGQVRIHPSRVVCFRADPLPELMGSASWDDRFWGESRIMRLRDAADNSDTAQAAFAALITKARNTIIGIPGLSDIVSTETGEEALMKRLAAMQTGESMFNLTVRDAGDGTAGAGETIDHRQVVWTGMRDIILTYAEAFAAAADIPMTRFWGKSAEGMSASGDSQQRDWKKMVRARQELELRPCLDHLDQALIPSALGATAPDVWWQFAPLETPSEAEEATRFKTTMDAMEKAQSMGFIPEIAFAKAGQNTMAENGWMPGLDGALAEVPEAERFGLLPDGDDADPSELTEGGDQFSGGTGERAPVRRAANDAKPRPLYVHRKLLNAAEVISWAKGQGFTTTLPADDMHCTILYSRTAVDPIKMGETWSGDEQGRMTIKPGGPRAVEKLGDTAVVLMFASYDLVARHADMVRAGASHDYPEYQPHVTLTYEAPDGLDLDAVKPFTGKLVFGPEVFAALDEDWKSKIAEA